MADYKKPDYWTLKAKKEGYPARSVYKLREMDEKFSLLKTGRALRVLDLGAAPGSWSLYVLRRFPASGAASPRNNGSGFLVSVDLSPLSRQYDKGLFDSENFCFIQGDITEAGVREAITAKGPYNLIISDAAPATSGSHALDAARSLELAESVLGYAESVLCKGGNLALKIFQGGDSAELLKRIKALFTTAKSFKPLACRSESFETYYVGLGKR
jgi:23S rRNA (uridine2552-2'-O)-methyltransferase